MKSRAIYSGEPALGWLPWGALTPFLCTRGITAIGVYLNSGRQVTQGDFPLPVELGPIDGN